MIDAEVRMIAIQSNSVAFRICSHSMSFNACIGRHDDGLVCLQRQRAQKRGRQFGALLDDPEYLVIRGAVRPHHPPQYSASH